MEMLQVSTVLFVLAAAGGAVMAAVRLRSDRNPPVWLAMGHGMLAAAALTLLVYAAWIPGVPTLAQASLVLFLLAAAGGVYMNLVYHWRHQLIPQLWVWAHTALAVVALLLLIVAAF